MSNELTVYDRVPTIYDRVSDPLAYAERMGFAMAKSGMFGLANEQAGMVVAMTCLCDGITPLEFQKTYHIVEGQPSMRSDAMLAEFRNRGGKHEVLKRSADGASVLLTAADGSQGEYSLTWEEAQKEDFVQGKDGGVKHNYAYPRKRMQMLWARVISDGVRTLTPEIVAGVYTPEETEDFEPAVAPTSLPRAEPKKVTAPETAEIVKEPARIDGRTEGPLRANDVQVARILQLFQQLEFPVDKIDAALAKRGVIKISLLTPFMADEMIEKLQGMVAEKN